MSLDIANHHLAAVILEPAALGPDIQWQLRFIGGAFLSGGT
jgi:hypothetical protein